MTYKIERSQCDTQLDFFALIKHILEADLLIVR